MTNRLRGGIVGTGYSAGMQVRAWRAVPAVDIVAVADLSRHQAATFAAEFDIVRAYGDLGEMLAQEALDFVDLATPPESHEDLVRAAASHGANVLCQKPIAESLPALRRMIDVCRHAGVAFAVNENCRFQPWFRRMKQLLVAGDVGSIVSATFLTRARLSYPIPRFERQPYFVNMQRLIIFELGVHFLDTLRYLLGPAESIYAITQQVGPRIHGEDVAAMLIRHRTGTSIVDMSWAAVATDRRERIGWADVRIEGTLGSLHLTTDGELTVASDEGTRMETFGGDPIANGFVGAQFDFARSLLDHREPETSASDQLDTMELVFGAYESAATGNAYRVGLDIGTIDE